MNDLVTFRDLLIIAWGVMALMIIGGLIGYYSEKWKNRKKS